MQDSCESKVVQVRGARGPQNQAQEFVTHECHDPRNASVPGQLPYVPGLQIKKMAATYVEGMKGLLKGIDYFKSGFAPDLFWSSVGTGLFPTPLTRQCQLWK